MSGFKDSKIFVKKTSKDKEASKVASWKRRGKGFSFRQNA